MIFNNTSGSVIRIIFEVFRYEVSKSKFDRVYSSHGYKLISYIPTCSRDISIHYLTSRARNLLTFVHDKLSDTQQQSFLHRPCVTICTCPSAYIAVAAVLSQPSYGTSSFLSTLLFCCFFMCDGQPLRFKCNF